MTRPQQPTGIKRILLRGIFWRIVIIEAILLALSLAYRYFWVGSGQEELLCYAMRIIAFVGAVLAFIMLTLSTFLHDRVISPLQAITKANRRLSPEGVPEREVDLPRDAAREFQEIDGSRRRMLDTILQVSEERLRLVDFIRRTFGRYVPEQIVDEILKNPEAQKLGGRRKTVTVLFSDLRGFTQMAGDRDPEEVVQLLNLYLERMNEIIILFGGVIDEIIGDGILAIFGALEEKDDDSARAVACALAMQNNLADLNQQIVAHGHAPLEMGIGINSGPVIVGNIGSERRMKYAIVGHTVNQASRIESNAVGGQVLVGESTFKEVEALVEHEKPSTVLMKGLRQPMSFYPVTAIGPPYDISLAQIPTGPASRLCLVVEALVVDQKMINDQKLKGHTLGLSPYTLDVDLPQALDPFSNIKLSLKTPKGQHPFDDIYAKVMSVEEVGGSMVHHLRITGITPKDWRALSGLPPLDTGP